VSLGGDDTIRRAIGGDAEAVAWIVAHVDTTEVALVIVMAALHERDPFRLDRARALAVTSRDRQVVEIARAHLDGRGELVDALARDHLVDHPDSLIVAWIASDAVRGQPKEGR
jgi:MoxR-like ATPase